MADVATIALLLPTRGRPEQLKSALLSIFSMSMDARTVKVVLGMDDDDLDTIHFVRSDVELSKYSANIRLIAQPRAPTLGYLIDSLYRFSDDCDIVGWATDDIKMLTYGWDHFTRVHVVSKPFGVHYPSYMGVKDFCIAPFLHQSFARSLRLCQGFVSPGYFPYWFNDTWLDEIGDLIGSKNLLPWELGLPGGQPKPDGSDLAFWVEFFDYTRPLRVSAAQRLLIRQAEEFASIVSMKRANLRTPQFIAQWQGEENKSERYLKALRYAQNLMEQGEDQ